MHANNSQKPSAKQTLLAIDNGSQSVRAILFDATGAQLYSKKINIEPYFSEQNGWAEQHPEYYWQKVGEACQDLWQQGANPEDVAGLSVTTQRSTMVFLDEQGQPLRPAITWMDERRQEQLAPISLLWNGLINIVGKQTTLKNARERAPSNWVAANQPEIWRKTAKYLQLSGYLNYMLTGKFRDAKANQVGYIPYDYAKQDWAASHMWHWQAYNLEPRHLPELLDSGNVIGYLQTCGAEHLGLPEGLAVIASGSDKSCELIGAGLLDESIACLSYGTRATISTHSTKYRELMNQMPAYTAALPKHFSAEIAVPRGFWMVSWFKKEFGLPEVQKAAELGTTAELLFDELINSVPAGSQGLVLQPFWGSEIINGLEARGSIIGFSGDHSRAHLYRAMIEGIIFALHEGKDLMESRGTPKVKTLRVSGGGSQSDAIMQITADIFNLPAERSHTCETSGLGAAIITAVGLGWYPDIKTAMQAMTSQTDTFTPIKENHQIYQKLYKNIYRNMYKQLNPLYKYLHKYFS